MRLAHLYFASVVDFQGIIPSVVFVASLHDLAGGGYPGTSTPELDKLLVLSECFHVTLDELTGGTPCEADTGSVRRTKTDGFRQTKQKVGIGLCVLGAVLLLAVGAVMLAVPDAADRLNESSAVTLNGSGLLLVLCVLFMAAGLVLILRKK